MSRRRGGDLLMLEDAEITFTESYLDNEEFIPPEFDKIFWDNFYDLLAGEENETN